MLHHHYNITHTSLQLSFAVWMPGPLKKSVYSTTKSYSISDGDRALQSIRKRKILPMQIIPGLSNKPFTPWNLNSCPYISIIARTINNPNEVLILKYSKPFMNKVFIEAIFDAQELSTTNEVLVWKSFEPFFDLFHEQSFFLVLNQSLMLLDHTTPMLKLI